MNSLFGGNLTGNKLVRIVYLDEAGISDPKVEPYTTVAGVIVHADHQLIPVEQHLQRLIEKHIPEHQRDGFVFQAKEIFGGGKTMDRKDPYWTETKRMEVAVDIAQIPSMFDLKIALGQWERSNILSDEQFKDASKKIKTALCVSLAFFESAVRVEKWMRGNAENEVCMMIWEDNHDNRQWIRTMQQDFQKENVFEKATGDLITYLPFRHIREDPSFQAKRPTSVLSVADFCAYVWKKMFDPLTLEKFRPYIMPWANQRVDELEI